MRSFLYRKRSKAFWLKISGIWIILVDDGSAQECTKIARDYAARHAPIIRYLEHPGTRTEA